VNNNTKLRISGKKPGEVKMVRNGDIVEAHQVCSYFQLGYILVPSLHLLFFLYQWDSESSTWVKIGDVVDAASSGNKQVYEGKEYDYVFDVDIKDGVPALKLPYNVNGKSDDKRILSSLNL
jgi:phospholipase A-2-activating protein